MIPNPKCDQPVDLDPLDTLRDALVHDAHVRKTLEVLRECYRVACSRQHRRASCIHSSRCLKHRESVGRRGNRLACE